MHPTLVLALLASTVSAQTNSTPVTGILGDAAVISNNPSDSIYTATLPDNDKSSVRGSVVAQGVRGGPGVHFDVNLSGLPGSGGPFLYHIHAFPVPADGNCTGTLAHLDPYERGEVPTCDAASPATCQVGDLSGKHGKIPDNSSTFSASYVDDYASTLPGIGAYFGNRSVVIHYANKTRITCANFTVASTASPPYAAGNATAAMTMPVASSTATAGPAMYTGAAAHITGFGLLAGLAGAAALAF